MTTPPDFFASANEPDDDDAAPAPADGARNAAPAPADDLSPAPPQGLTAPPHAGEPTHTGPQQRAVPPQGWEAAPRTGEPRSEDPPPAQPNPGGAAAQQAHRQPRHQQPQPRPQPSPPVERAHRGDQYAPSERTTALSAALREHGRDLGVGDFFDSSSGGGSSQAPWPPAQEQSSGPSRFDNEFDGDADPFGSGARDEADRPSSHRSLELTGWRKLVEKGTFGQVQPRPSAKALHDDELLRRITASLTDVYVVAFVSTKGGVGKTTMAVAAGNAIARNRGDRVIVVDVDTDLGDAASRFEDSGGAKANIQALSEMPSAGSYANVRVFTVQNKDRLEILSSQNDPRSSYRLNGRDFEQAMGILRTHYNVILLDCGTSITSPLFPTIARQVNCLVVVASNDRPGSRAAWKTLAWLQAHGFGRLLPRTVVILNSARGDAKTLDLDAAETTFRGQIDEVVTVPYDAHLNEGDFILFDRMAKKSRKAVMELAGAIARYYPTRHRHHRGDDLGGY